MATREVSVRLSGRDETRAAFSAAGKSVAGFEKSIADANKRMKTAVAGMSTKLLAVGASYATLATAREALSLFGDRELAEAKMADALDRLGVGGPVARAAMDDFAESIQRQTTLSKEAVLHLSALGANLGKLSGEDLQRATIAAVGFSKAMGVDLDTAMRAVAKSARGDSGSLKEFGVVVDTTLPLVDQFNEVLRQGADAFSAARTEANTTTGQLTAFSVQVNALKADLGGQLAPWLKVTTEAIREMGDALSEIDEGMFDRLSFKLSNVYRLGIGGAKGLLAQGKDLLGIAAAKTGAALASGAGPGAFVDIAKDTARRSTIAATMGAFQQAAANTTAADWGIEPPKPPGAAAPPPPEPESPPPAPPGLDDVADNTRRSAELLERVGVNTDRMAVALDPRESRFQLRAPTDLRIATENVHAGRMERQRQHEQMMDALVRLNIAAEGLVQKLGVVSSFG